MNEPNSKTAKNDDDNNNNSSSSSNTNIIVIIVLVIIVVIIVVILIGIIMVVIMQWKHTDMRPPSLVDLSGCPRFRRQKRVCVCGGGCSSQKKLESKACC